MRNPGFRVALCHGPKDLKDALAIREAVFVQEQSIPLELDRDGRDEQSLHVVVREGETPVATGRVLISDEAAAVAARIAVLPSHRGRGLGKMVIERLERLARGRGAAKITLQPHAHLEAFYRKLGYKKTGEAPPVGPHPLICMEKML